MEMASKGHTLTHLPHPIQATLHAFIATAPLSRFLQAITTLRFLGNFFLSSIRSRGQASTQAPQATQLSSMINGTPDSGLKSIALKSQAS